MWEALRTIGHELSGDVRVVVVRGEGRAFSAGLDLGAVSASSSAAPPTGPSAEGSIGEPVHRSDPADSADSAENSAPVVSFDVLARAADADATATIARFQEGFAWLRRPDLVSIAAVRGHAIGAGFQLALACDLRVLAEDAQFTMAEVALGLVPDLGGTKRLVELVGYARALEICLTGRRIGAQEADRLGLATSVVPGADLDQAVDDLTSQILSAHRDAVVEIKALLLTAAGQTFAEQEAAERSAQLRRIRDLIGLGE